MNLSIISCTSTYWDRSTGKYSDALETIRSSILFSLTAGMVTSLVAIRPELITKRTFFVAIFLFLSSSFNISANSLESFFSNIFSGVENENESCILVSLPLPDTSRTLIRLCPISILSTLFAMFFSKLIFIYQLKLFKYQFIKLFPQSIAINSPAER